MQPSFPEPSKSWQSDIASCRALLATGSKSFFAASWLLPRRIREPASALYAFCRVADDAVDIDAEQTRAVDRLRERLDRLYAFRPLDHPIDRALSVVIDRYAIPRELLDALLDGFQWDLGGRRYATIAELHAYSARVAGTVGVIMALLMGVRDQRPLARAADLGIAMQLTNIARDVGEDARSGRLYLPLDWLEEAGIDADAWLANPVFTPLLQSVLTRLLDTADTLYGRADDGIAALPADCRPGIAAARLLYAEIGHELRRSGFDSVSRRTVVPGPRKAALLARAAARGFSGARGVTAPCLDQARFLVEAVRALPEREDAVLGPGSPWWDFHGQALWVIDLFERLERRELTEGAPEAIKAGA